MLQNLQTLRVLFTLMVVTAHLEPIYRLLGVDQFVSPFARLSVDGFIVASAFLIPYTHARRPRSPLGFLGRRFVRLVPLYWLMTLIVAALALAAPFLFQTTTITPETLLKSLFFIPYEKSPGIVQPIIFVGWTMTYFVFFMLVYAVALKIAGRWAWAASAGFLSALVVIGWVLKPTDVVIAFFTSSRLLAFVAGQLVCAWWLHVQDRVSAADAPIWLKPALYGVIGLGFTTIALRDSVLLGVDPRLSGAVLAGLVIMAVLMLERLGETHRGALRDQLANASFAIYLTHYFVTQAAVKIAEALQTPYPLALLALLAGAYVGVAILGVLAARHLERPLESIAIKAWERALAMARRAPRATPPQSGSALRRPQSRR